MKYIRLFEERLQDFEIMTMDSEPLIRELEEEIKKEDSDLDYIKDLVFYGHFDVNVIWKNERGTEWTFLMKASYLSKPEIVKFLLEEGADPNVQNKWGITALHVASQQNKSQAVQELLKHPKIDPNIQNDDGQTALHWASKYSRSQAIQALLDHPKTDVTITDNNDELPCDVATDEILEEFPELYF